MGVMLALAFLAGLYWWWKMGRVEHWAEISLLDAYFLATMPFWVGG